MTHTVPCFTADRWSAVRTRQNHLSLAQAAPKTRLLHLNPGRLSLMILLHQQRNPSGEVSMWSMRWNESNLILISVHASSSREVKAGIPCSIGAGRRGFDPRQPPTHEACLLSAVGDLKWSLVPFYWSRCKQLQGPAFWFWFRVRWFWRWFCCQKIQILQTPANTIG